MSSPNLKQLAEKLGISVSTVSRALRNTYDIGPETKKRVQELAAEMSYVPNPYARQMRSRQSRTVALLLPELTNNFFVQAISGAETIARQNDYHLLIYVTKDDFKQEQNILKHLQTGRVDGIIISLSGDTKNQDHLLELIQNNIPVVVFDRICHEIETVKVVTDDFVSGFNATEHLILQGCKDIAYLSFFENLSIDLKRKQGYLEALYKYNLPIKESRIIKCNSDDKSNYKKIKQLLGNQPPDGIFSCIEKLAFTTYEVCSNLQLKIPDDVKVICFSNLEIAHMLNPPLSTITQPAFEMGKQAAAMLFKYLDKKNRQVPNDLIVIKSVLMERESTRRTSQLPH